MGEGDVVAVEVAEIARIENRMSAEAFALTRSSGD
jgi:hypothetical protein